MKMILICTMLSCAPSLTMECVADLNGNATYNNHALANNISYNLGVVFIHRIRHPIILLLKNYSD